MGWAQFLEQKYLSPKPKEKRVKKTKKADATKEEQKEEEDEWAHLKPSVYDTLPFQIVTLCKMVPELPTYAKVTVQCAVCSVQCVVCSVQCVVCSV